MSHISYISTLNLSQKSLLIIYKPIEEFLHQVVHSFESLQSVIQAHCQNYPIYVICSEQSQETIRKRYADQEKINIFGSSNPSKEQNQILHIQEDLLQRVNDDEKQASMEKVNNLLEEMIKKTQRKIHEANLDWNLGKINTEIKKYEQIKQKNAVKSEQGDKRAKKLMKEAEKKLSDLRLKKKQFYKNQKQKDGIIEKQKEVMGQSVEIEEQDSLLLCNEEMLGGFSE